MSAYMVLPTQQAIVATLALRYSRSDVLSWVKAVSEKNTDVIFEKDSHAMIKQLNAQSTDAEISKALIQLFSMNNFVNLCALYNCEIAIEMACTEEEIEIITQKADGDLSLLPKLALENYINLANNSLEDENVKACIDTTSEQQYLVWLRNLNYQSCDHDQYDDTLFASLVNLLTGHIDFEKPEFVACEWSCDVVISESPMQLN